MTDTNVDVAKAAGLLDSYANHFEHRDWNYTRDLGELGAIRYDNEYDSLWGRIKRSARWLFHRKRDWEKEWAPSNLRMAKHALKRDKHLPDGVLDGGSIITFWEETGEYLQLVQPTVGDLLAKFLAAEPDHPHARAIAAEILRISQGYHDRLNPEEN